MGSSAAADDGSVKDLPGRCPAILRGGGVKATPVNIKVIAANGENSIFTIEGGKAGNKKLQCLFHRSGSPAQLRGSAEGPAEKRTGLLLAQRT